MSSVHSIQQNQELKVRKMEQEVRLVAFVVVVVVAMEWAIAVVDEAEVRVPDAVHGELVWVRLSLPVALPGRSDPVLDPDPAAVLDSQKKDDDDGGGDDEAWNRARLLRRGLKKKGQLESTKRTPTTTTTKEEAEAQTEREEKKRTKTKKRKE